MDETDLCQHLLILFYCFGNNDLEVILGSGGWSGALPLANTVLLQNGER